MAHDETEDLTTAAFLESLRGLAYCHTEGIGPRILWLKVSESCGIL